MTLVAQKKSFYHLANILRLEKPSSIILFLNYTIKYLILKFILKKRYAHRRIHGFKMRLDLQDPGISRSLYLLGDREREHLYLLKKSIRPHQRILDIGANIGYYVLIEHQLLGQSGHVIALEPSPKNFSLLKKNISLNHLTNRTTLLHTALATKDGFAPLHLSKLSNVHSLIAKNTDSPMGHFISVPTTSLETIIRDQGPIDLVRMDIEGYEYFILKSLISINQNQEFKPDIVLELHPPKYNKGDFIQLIKDLYELGYQAKLIASSHFDLLNKNNLTVTAKIPTDGTIRSVSYTHLTLPTN